MNLERGLLTFLTKFGYCLLVYKSYWLEPEKDLGNRSFLRKEIVLGMYSFDDPENPEENGV